MRIVSALLALVVAGCSTLPLHVEHSTYEANCASSCFDQCPPLNRWDGTADSASALLRIDGLMYRQCEERRAACSACIERLKQAKVIK